MFMTKGRGMLTLQEGMNSKRMQFPQNNIWTHCKSIETVTYPPRCIFFRFLAKGSYTHLKKDQDFFHLGNKLQLCLKNILSSNTCITGAEIEFFTTFQMYSQYIYTKVMKIRR